MARRVIAFITLFTASACSGGSAGLEDSPGGAADMGPTSFDLAPPAIDLSPPDGGGEGVPDAGPAEDGGPVIRTVEARPLLTPREIRNHVLLPDFDDQVINGGWLALDLQSGTPRETQRRTRWDAPGDRREIVKLPEEGGAGYYGFGVVPPGDVVGSVWLGMQDASEAEWAELVSGLIVYAPSIGSAILVFQPTDDVRSTEDVEWRRFSGRAQTEIVGRFVFGIQAPLARAVFINSPHVESLDMEPGARSGRGLDQMPPDSAWTRAAEAMRLRSLD